MGQAGWAGGLSGFSGGISKGYQMMIAMQDRERALEAERMFGDTLRGMYGPQPPEPMPGAPTGVQNAPMRPMPFPTSPMPQAQPPMMPPPQGARPPMQIPGRPLPGGEPPVTAQALPPPQRTMQPPGGGPAPLPQPPMPNMPPGGGSPASPMSPGGGGGPPPGMPGPMTMQRPGFGGRGGQFETMGTQPQLPRDLTWQNILTQLARTNPGADSATLGRVVDRLMPLMNSQSQMEWRELSGRIKMLEHDRQTRQGDERIDIAKGNAQTRRDQLQETKRFHNERINKIKADIDKIATQAKLPPEQKASLDMYTNVFKQAATTTRVARTNLQKAMWEGTEENKADAQQDVEEAQAAEDEARTALQNFVGSLGVKTKLDLSTEPPAAPTAPAAGTPPAAAKPPAKVPGPSSQKKPAGGAGGVALEGGFPQTTTPDGEVIVTKPSTGTRMQVGNAPPPKATGMAKRAPAVETGGVQGGPVVRALSSPVPVTGSVTPSPKAIGYLLTHPELAGAFDVKYGRGASKRYLAGKKVGAPSERVR